MIVTSPQVKSYQGYSHSTLQKRGYKNEGTLLEPPLFSLKGSPYFSLFWEIYWQYFRKDLEKTVVHKCAAFRRVKAGPAGRARLPGPAKIIVLGFLHFLPNFAPVPGGQFGGCMAIQLPTTASQNNECEKENEGTHPPSSHLICMDSSRMAKGYTCIAPIHQKQSL